MQIWDRVIQKLPQAVKPVPTPHQMQDYLRPNRLMKQVLAMQWHWEVAMQANHHHRHPLQLVEPK